MLSNFHGTFYTNRGRTSDKTHALIHRYDTQYNNHHFAREWQMGNTLKPGLSQLPWR